MSEERSIIRVIQEAIERYNEECKKNPRHNIDFLTGVDGCIKVYFPSVELGFYNRGRAARGSTERFYPTDIVVRVPAERIEAITEGNTIVDTREWGGIQ